MDGDTAMLICDALPAHWVFALIYFLWPVALSYGVFLAMRAVRFGSASALVEGAGGTLLLWGRFVHALEPQSIWPMTLTIVGIALIGLPSLVHAAVHGEHRRRGRSPMA